jgi:murein DD-endopeptidase
MFRLSDKRIGLLLSLFLGLHPTPALAQAPPNAPVEIRVPLPPTPVKANGRTVLAYEIHVTNFQARDITLNRVEVLAADAASRPVISLKDDGLLAAINRPGPSATVTDKRVIGGGLRAVVYMWLAFDNPGAVPRSLRHRLLFTVTGADGKNEDRDMEAAVVEVVQKPPVVMSAPLKGGIWLAGNGPSNTSEHRRAMIPVFGQPRIAQRFAIDWLKLGDDGKGFHGDPKVNANWYGYGADVLAVADGVVTDVKDGIRENVPLESQRAVPITLDTIAGNHVILSIGDGRFALYAHLQPGSLRVKPGQRVRRGQVLGLLGNSGNSDAPHLHFHIGSDNSALAAEGLPYVLESFSLLGRTTVDDVFERGWTPAAGITPEKRQHEIPEENQVIKFD